MPGCVHVVDDDASFRSAVERRLKNAGYEVVTYPSAQELLDDLPDESKLGCILLDVRIPGLSGPDLQARLIDLGSTLPIVFLTGHAGDAAFCIVLDINLNDGSGIELRRQLSERGVSLPVIFITGNDSDATRAAALQSGCTAYLPKPFPAQSLIDPIRRASTALA